MSNIKKNTASSAPVKRRADETAVDERLEKDADEMADQATETEERYDDEHGIFTK